MANQVIVTNTGNVQVALTPPPNVQVQISRAAIGTVSNVPTANFANYAGNVTGANQPNITGLGTLSNLSVTGTVTSGNVSTPTVYSQGMQMQGYDYVQMQYSNSVALPVSPYDIGTGSWFYLDAGGAVWQSNTTGALQTVVLGNNGNISATGNITAPYFIGNGSQLTGIVANSVANANYANFAGEAYNVNVANVTGLGNIATVNLDGNVSNLLTGAGTFVAIPTGGGNTDNISNGTSNVSIPVVDGNVQVYANNQHWTFTDVGNLLLAGGNSVVQSIANSSLDILNPNVSTMVLTPDQGYTSQALVLDPTFNGHIHLRAPGSNIDQPVANLYLGGEISSFEVGQFNGAVPNLFIHSNNNTWTFDINGNLILPGNTFAVNYANGTQVPLDGPVANANYANFAGTAYSVDGANVSGEVANANYSSYANIATSANSVALANVSGIGNIANINLDGNASNILFGNGTFNAIPVVSNVANANYANFAGTAYSVSGANVSGEVANANFASYANIASSANSVALANVSGIGNIATVNLDGSSSNVLFGNGVFAPESTSIANANYANFAGNLINGTSNITIPTANGNIVFGVGGNSDLLKITSAGIVNSTPATTSLNSYVINSYDTGSDAKRIASFKYRGNIATPLSVNPGDTTMRLITLGHNGAALQTSSTASIRGLVDASYTANGANIPLGWQVQVNDTNGGINNQTKTHNFYSNGNVSFANAIFGNSLSVTGNVTGNYIIGNGSSLSSLTGGNVTGAVAFATTANSVAVGNVSGIGNIATLNLDGNASNVLLGNGVFSSVTSSSILANGTSNISIPAANGNIVFSPAGIANAVNIQTTGQMAIAPGPSALNGVVINSYGLTTDPHRIASFKYRGNVTTPLSVQPSDVTMRLITGGSNGTALQTSSLASLRAVVDSSYTANGANIPIGWQFTVNDTNGGVNNQQKTHNFYANGNVVFANSGQFGSTSQDTTFKVLGNNVNGYAEFNGVSVRVFQDQANGAAGYSPFYFFTYQANNDPIPSSKFFRAGGTQASPSAVTNGSNIALNQYAAYADSGNVYKPVFEQQVTITSNDGVGNLTGNMNFYSYKANSNINLQANTYISAGGGGGATTLTLIGDKTTNSGFTLFDAQFSTTMNNVDTTTGYSPFRFQQYAPTSNQFGPMYYYRSRGTGFANSLPVVANDKIMSYNFLVNSNNVTTSVGQFESTVTYNDNAGNVGSKLDFNAIGTGTTGYLNGSINLLANTTSANNFNANNVSINNSVNGFMKLSSYTEANLTAITGQVGWMAAVTDSGGGGNPNGMIAFWDTTHSRWSYIHDNSAV